QLLLEKINDPPAYRCAEYTHAREFFSDKPSCVKKDKKSQVEYTRNFVSERSSHGQNYYRSMDINLSVQFTLQMNSSSTEKMRTTALLFLFYR
ncbi:hypothetical protein L9F63_008503, partial [Diploptera punctata]